MIKSPPIPVRVIPGSTQQRSNVEATLSARQSSRDVSVTTRGTRRSRLYEKFFASIVDTYPWDKVLFGYTPSGATLSVKAGEIHFKGGIYSSVDTDVVIAANNTYVFVQMEWGTGIPTIGSTTTKSEATTDDQYYRKWLYLMSFDGTTATVLKYGHTGGAIVIMPVLG